MTKRYGVKKVLKWKFIVMPAHKRERPCKCSVCGDAYDRPTSFLADVVE